jgi:predicted anti-sigma-YlaC factor YlaD
VTERHDGQESGGLLTHDEARAELSAWLDGEQSAVLAVPLAEHLAGCLACQEWQKAAQNITRQVRTTPAGPVPDQTERVLAAVLAERAAERRPRRFTPQLRAALGAVAAAQFVIIVPAILGHAGGGTPVHSSRELGVFNLALAVGFAVAALRPSLARGMLPLAGFASAALIVASLVDSAMSYTTVAAEAPHLITALGAVLLYMLVRAGGRQPGSSPAGRDITRRTGLSILEIAPRRPDEPNGA